MIDELYKWRHAHTKYPLEHVFQWMEKRDPRRREIEAVMEQHEEAAIANHHPGEYASYTFRHSVELPGLQCVDVLAWVSYQQALWLFCNTPLHPEAHIGLGDFDGHLGGAWREAYNVPQITLEKWVNNPAMAGHTKQWFEDWKKRKLAEKRSNGKKRSRKI